MSETKLKEYNELFEKAKENFEKNNIDLALKQAEELFENNVSNEYLYQMVISIYYNNKDYEKAFKLSELAIEKYGGEVNDDNLFKILNKIHKDPGYDLPLNYFKNHIKKMLNNMSPKTFELLKIYLDNQIDNLENYNFLKELYDNKKINRETQLNSYLYMYFNHHVFNETNEQGLANFLKDELELKELDDEIIINKINNIDNIVIWVLAFFYLTFPRILNLSENDINWIYKRINNNLDKLIMICTCKFNDPSILYKSFPVYYFYYMVYYGLNNKILYQKVSKLFQIICPNINYSSKNLLIKNTDNKIRVGFISNLIFQNHSVCKDRIGIIKSLIDDPRFEVYLFGDIKETEQIYTDRIGPSFKNRIILTKSIEESRKTIESYNLDILVYPEIGMDFYYWVLAHSKLAKIQINTWGHSETSGIDTFDYYISSEYYENDTAQENYSEKLIRLKSLSTYYYSLNHFEYFNKINKTSRESKLFDFNLPTNCHLYGVFQTAFKYHHENMQIIKKLLEQDPKAIIIMLGLSGNPQRFSKYLETTLGYDINRVRLLDRLVTLRYHKLISCMDVILDSYPFGGCNTSMDSFNFNKIVVTLPSNKINGRFTYGFYQKMQILEPIALTPEEFVKKSIEFCSNIELRTQIENKIKEKKSLLFEEQASINTWKTMLFDLINNQDKDKTNITPVNNNDIKDTKLDNKSIQPTQPIKLTQLTQLNHSIKINNNFNEPDLFRKFTL